MNFEKLLKIRPKYVSLSQNNSKQASFIIRSLAYLIDILIIFTARYLFWIGFSMLWFRKAAIYFYEDFNDSFSLVLSKDRDEIQQYEYYEMGIYFLKHSFLLDILFVFSFIFFLGTFYYLYMHYNYQQTFGKKLFNIKLFNADEASKPSFIKILFRYIIGLIPWILTFFILIFIFAGNSKIGLILLIITVLWYDPLLFGKDRRTIHDYIMSTKVIKLKTKAKNQ